MREEINKLDIGSGRPKMNGYVTLDRDPIVGADITADFVIDNVDGQYGEIRAHHVLEHIKPEDKVLAMRRLYDLLAPGGLLDIEVPLAGTVQSHMDPTHLSFWCAESFWYFERGNRFGEAFAKRYSQCEVPLFEVEEPAKVEGWKLNIVFRKPLA
jgi:hypothetical protein